MRQTQEPLSVLADEFVLNPFSFVAQLFALAA
jgi:hypothetical protein